MRKHDSWIVAAVVLTAVLLGCTGKDSSGTTEQNNGPIAEKGPGSKTITAFGTVVATGRREIQLPWPCRIVEVPLWEGQRVKLGETLIVFDYSDFNYALEGARLQMEASASLLAEANSQLAALDVQLAEVTGRWERNRRMRDSGSVSPQELDSVEAELNTLKYQRAASAWTVSAKESETEGLTGAYQLMLNQAGADHIDQNRLVCPLDTAVVAEILIRPGAEAEDGNPLLILYDQNALVVEANLPEEFVRDVNKGARAMVIPVADPERSYSGVVVELAGRAKVVNGETVVGTRIRLDAPDDFLREGFNVDVEIEPAG